MMFLDLPKSYVARVMSSWIGEQAVTNLDTSHCHDSSRDLFLEILRHDDCTLNGKSLSSKNALYWACSRSVKLQCVNLNHHYNIDNIKRMNKSKVTELNCGIIMYGALDHYYINLINDCPNLTKLSFTNCDEKTINKVIHKTDVRILSQISEISISFTNKASPYRTNTYVSGLSTFFSKLTSIVLSDVRIKAAQLIKLCKVNPLLKGISIENSVTHSADINKDLMRAIVACPALTELFIGVCDQKLVFDFLPKLLTSTTITEFDLNGLVRVWKPKKSTTNKAIAFNHMRSDGHCHDCYDEIVHFFNTNEVLFTRVDVHNLCGLLDDDLLRLIADKNPNITEITFDTVLNGGTVSKKAMAYVLQNCTQLKKIKFQGDWKNTHILYIMNTPNQISTVTVCDNDRIDMATLVKLVDGNSNIMKLSVKQCDNVNSDELCEWLTAIQRCGL